MKREQLLVDGILVDINVPETSNEYRQGARASGHVLAENEGYRFSYDIAQRLEFENTAVPFDIKVLYLQAVDTDNSMFVVLDEVTLDKDSSKIRGSRDSFKEVIELRKDFCDKYKIGAGSVVSTLLVGQAEDV